MCRMFLKAGNCIAAPLIGCLIQTPEKKTSVAIFGGSCQCPLPLIVLTIPLLCQYVCLGKKQSHVQCSFAFFSKRISVTATCVIIVYLVHIRAVCSDTTPHV